MSHVCLEPAAPCDADGILALYKSHIGADGVTWNDSYPNEDTIRYDIEHGLLYLYRLSDDIVGALTMGAIGDEKGLPSVSGAKNPCDYARLCVASSMQGRGIAEQMLCAAEVINRQRGFDCIRLIVAVVNKRAINLYEKCGFTRLNGTEAYGIEFYQYMKHI